MPSNRYRQLARNLGRVRDALLPPAGAALPPTRKGDVEALEHRISSYIVLCHAEFEAYIEDRALDVAQRCVHSWTRHHRHGACVTSLVTFYVRGEVPAKVLQATDQGFDKADLQPLLQAAFGAHEDRVNKNNGIKTKDILALMMPLGVRMNSLPATLFLELDAYGSRRGNIAHNRWGHALRPVLNPNDEEARSGRVLLELIALDSILSDLIV